MTHSELSLDEIEQVVAGHHHDPHSVLGAHPGPDGVVVRALRPMATSVTLLLEDGRRLPMEHVHQGVFAVTLPDEKVLEYQIATTYPGAAGASSDAAGASSDAAGASSESVLDDPY